MADSPKHKALREFAGRIPLKAWIIIAVFALTLLLYFSSSISNFITGFRAGLTDARHERVIEAEKQKSLAAEERADTHDAARRAHELQWQEFQPEREQAATDADAARERTIPYKERYEQSKKIRSRRDVALNERERDALAADRALYPDADR